jgi:two-component system NarL family sensor kinase
VTLQDEERRRLAGIIHDDMLQWMAVGHTRLQIARRGIADPKQASTLDRAADAVQESITRMRTLMSELHPQVVERGFTTALSQYLEQVENDGDLHCVLDGSFANEPTGTVTTTLYRITCEAVVNARKHAAGSTVTVELSDRDAGYAVTVRDDAARGRRPSIHWQPRCSSPALPHPPPWRSGPRVRPAGPRATPSPAGPST